MAQHWAAKAPGSVYRYSWVPDLADGDSIASATLTVSSGTAVIDSYEDDGEAVTAYLSGGTAGAVTVITGSVVTSDGETLTETIYLPIVASTNAFEVTGLDIVSSALRKVIGMGETPEAENLTDGLEWLNDMLAEWAATGAYTSIPLPITATSVIYASDASLSAIRANLTIRCADNYGREISPVTVTLARTGLQRLKQANLPDDRTGADYY